MAKEARGEEKKETKTRRGGGGRGGGNPLPSRPTGSSGHWKRAGSRKRGELGAEGIRQLTMSGQEQKRGRGEEKGEMRRRREREERRRSGIFDLGRKQGRRRTSQWRERATSNQEGKNGQVRPRVTTTKSKAEEVHRSAKEGQTTCSGEKQSYGVKKLIRKKNRNARLSEKNSTRGKNWRPISL